MSEKVWWDPRWGFGQGQYFVLGIRNFETTDFAKHNKGFFKCSGRDWTNEFAYVTGGGATWK